MYIDTHLLWYIEDFIWKNLSIGYHDKIVTIKQANLIKKFRISTDLFWCKGGNTVRNRELFYWRLAERLFTPDRFILICHNKDGFDIIFRK